MRGLYYKIWVDAITATRAKRAEAASWKMYTLVPMSLLMGVNLFTFFLWMKALINKSLPLYFPVNIFNYLLINDYISVIATHFFPFVILNYLLIFNNKRYEKLLNTYPAQGGKLYRRYALVSIGLLIVPIVIAAMFF